MRVRSVALFCVSTLVWGAFPLFAHAEIVTMYAQLDDSGEMLSQQATYIGASIESESLGNLFLGKGSLRLTFTMKDPYAGNVDHTPSAVGLETCSGQNLQTYLFTDADRTLLSDGAFHTFTVETGTTTFGVADGETPICVHFLGLSQYHLGNHVKSNAAGTIPYLIIEGTPPPPPEVPQAPPGSVTVYTQNDNTGVMTNHQATYLGAYIDSASLGNLDVGQGELYITFTIRDIRASNLYRQPGGVCIEPADASGCSPALQMYFFTNADRDLLADHAYHTFMVKTGTTTSTYADGTRPVSIGFFGLSQWQYGTQVKSNADATIPYLKIQTPPPPDPCAAPNSCTSNVLFLPGIEGSRLYYRDIIGLGIGIEHQVWEPSLKMDIPYLAMNADGTSKYQLYTKDIVDTVQAHNPYWSTIARVIGYNNLESYSGFEHFMDTLIASSTVGLKEWRAYPYDWRYDVRDIVANGTPTRMQDNSIQQVYLKDVLLEIASSSPSHKVTIVAHSNGGLLAKALALSLGADASKYIDRIIMIGTPQWGTPSDIGVMLHGDDQTNGLGIISNSSDVRAVAETMPGTYGLLPTSAYFNHISDPVAAFNTGGLFSGEYATSFGEALTSFTALASFIEDSAGLDAQMGSVTDLRVPLALPSTLVDKATATHNVLDSWTPPAGITVTAIAGWGQDTVKTLAYSTGSKVVCTTGPAFTASSGCADTPELEHTPVLTQDGDNTVVSPSAVGNTSGSLYFNALDFVHNEKKNIVHRNLTSAQPIQNIIADLLKNKDASGEQYISVAKPPNDANPIKLRISSHSPVNLVVIDSSGNQSGVLPIPGTDFSGVKRDIPGSSVQVFDDEEYINVPQGGTYQVVANGYAAGSATLNIETVSGNGVASTTSSFTNIPTTASSTVVFSVVGGTPTTPAVDVNGDGITDFAAVSSSPGSDPLAYVRYMRAVVKALSLPKNKNQLDEKLGEIERQLASTKKGSNSNKVLLATLAHYVEQQVTLADSQKGISAATAEIILGMINQLKALL